MMSDFLIRLQHTFRQQTLFSMGYSPLYAALFETIVGWLSEGERDPLAAWLLEAGNGRSSFDIPLLLAAGLHRDILSHIPEVAELAAYYPTAVGSVALPFTQPQFADVLRQSILARQQPLAQFIQTANVQTNETGRGIAWLLPLLLTNWKAVHLVDLGASAGLNLLASERAYRLTDENGRTLVDMGSGRPVQFLMQSRNKFPIQHSSLSLQHSILSRTGCDIKPFLLKTAEDELILTAFIWGDQPQRVARLREGIQIYHIIQQGQAPIHLHFSWLPDDLLSFLHYVPAIPDAPVLIYNTYMTTYLPDKGAALVKHIQTWANTQNRPILWVQWEPPRPETPHQPPEFGWCAWTADLWHNQTHHQWRLGWVHPHGTQVYWETELADWISFWQNS